MWSNDRAPRRRDRFGLAAGLGLRPLRVHSTEPRAAVARRSRNAPAKREPESGADPFGGGARASGLALVRAMAERHGGRLKILSKPGAGTVVRMALPLRA